MDRISELLDNVQASEKARLLPKESSVYYRWMVEATNRIQELQARCEATEERLDAIMEHHGLSTGG